MCLVERGPTTSDAVFNDVLKMASVHYVYMWVPQWRSRAVWTQKYGSSLFDLAVVNVMST